MADNDTPGRPHGRARLRAGDAERQQMIDLLQEHVAAGRLDLPEFERRVEHAAAAIHVDDLDGLLDDLPPIGPDHGPEQDRAHRGRRRERGEAGSRGGRRRSPGGRAWGPAHRFGLPAPLLVLAAIALALLTHGWILIPLAFVIAGRGGVCGRRGGPRVSDTRGGRDEPRWSRPEDRAADPVATDPEEPAWPGRYRG